MLAKEGDVGRMDMENGQLDMNTEMTGEGG